MVNLKMNNDCGLERVIIVYGQEKETYSLEAQSPCYSERACYHTIVYDIKDIETAKKVKEAYIRGLYDGESYKEKEIKNKDGKK